MLFWIFVFLISSIGVVVGGLVLERVTEEWAERRGVTKEWAGFIILSLVSSSPELATAISGALKGYSNMVLGDILGGNLLNVAVFSLFSFLWYDLFKCLNRRVFYELMAWNIGFSVIMILALCFRVNLLWVFLLYPLLAYRLFERPKDEVIFHREDGHNSKFALYFVISTVMVISSSYFLMASGGRLSELTHISDTFIGTLFIAIITSAPELSTSFAALLRRAHGLCVGNILGSNMLNFFILPLSSPFLKGSFVASSSWDHVFTVLGLIVASLFSLLSIVFSLRPLRLLPVFIYIVVIFLLSKGV